MLNHNRLLLLAIALSLPALAYAESHKPRVVVLTDVSTWETDDSESLVRLLVHADLLEVEAIVFTTGWSLDTTRDDFLRLIHHSIDAYEKDLPNLRKRSGQNGHLNDESRQTIGYWPTAQSLRSRTVVGSRKRGAIHLGEGNDSAGSRLIIELADEDDDRPLWISLWGGGNTLAQAIWRVQKERGPQGLQTFLRKLRVYAITDQDRDQRTPWSDSSHQWMRAEFSSDLLFIWDESAWKFQNGTGKQHWHEYEKHIQTQGHLGKLYPRYKYGVEGDTPAFLHLLPIGLNDPNIPTHGGWGGYFAWGAGEDQTTRCFTNHKDPEFTLCRDLAQRFYKATFNNFAARMAWANNGTGNRNPVVVVDDDRTLEFLTKSPRPGTTVTLDASDSFDPDGDELTFRFWVLDAAGSYRNSVKIDGDSTSKATVHIPADSAGKTIHVICEVTDAGDFPLTSYRRVIFAPDVASGR